jgi:hypothetical protein
MELDQSLSLRQKIQPRKTYSAEALLTSSIPDLELHSRAFNVQSADFLKKAYLSESSSKFSGKIEHTGDEKNQRKEN